MFVSYWDAGFIALDVSEPRGAGLQGRHDLPGGRPTGTRTHRSYDDGRKLLFTADEDFCKTSGSGTEKGFGYGRVYDYANLGCAASSATTETANSLGMNDQGAGDFVIHNNFLVGDGRVHVLVHGRSPCLRRRRIRACREGSRVPSCHRPRRTPSSRRSAACSRTPHRSGASSWIDGLVYASDMNSGLWILELSCAEGPAPPGPSAGPRSTHPPHRRA